MGHENDGLSGRFLGITNYNNTSFTHPYSPGFIPFAAGYLISTYGVIVLRLVGKSGMSGKNRAMFP